ncbi:MAG: transporter, family, tetracycline resistance protein [Patescibacteria group bacterium]|nr:transporter, family, tetracycline resistance protein [Patescibacteria group bacterium]
MKNLQKHFGKKPLLAIFMTVFVDLVGVGILIPIFPQLITPGSPDNILPAGWTFKDGLILLGWLSAAYPIAQFLAAPILGQLSDKFGRKKVLTISILGTAIGYALFAIGIATKNIPLLFASRILDGVTGGNISVAQAAIADISTDKNRAKNFGLIGMAFGLGFILGPYIGGKLADPGVVSWFSAATPFWFAMGLSLFNMLLITLFLPETLKIKSTKRVDIAKPFHNIASALTRPGLRSVMPSSFLFTAGFTFFTTFFGVVLVQKFSFSTSSTGDYFAYVGLWIAVVQGALVGAVSKRFKDYQVLRVSMFISAIALLGYVFIPAGEYKWLFLVPPLMSLGNGLTMAFNSSLISRITPKNMQGEAMGINSSVMDLPRVYLLLCPVILLQLVLIYR